MAAADSGRPLYAAPYRLIFTLRDTAGAPVSGATSLDSEYSLAGASFADCTNEATEIGTSGVYTLDLVAAEMTSTSIVVKVTSAEAVTHVQEIVPEPCLDAGVPQGATSGSFTLAATASGSDDVYNGALLEIVRGTGAGQIRAVTDYTGSSQVVSLDRDWAITPDTTSDYIIHPRPGVPSTTAGYVDADMRAIMANATAATGAREFWKGCVIEGSISDSSPTTTDFDGDSGLSSTDDFYNNHLLVFSSGTLAGITSKISDYTGSSRNITLSSALPATPSNGDEFVILGRVF